MIDDNQELLGHMASAAAVVTLLFQKIPASEVLTHLPTPTPLEKMTTILSEDNFKCILLKWKWFRIEIHWNLFPGVQLTISQHGFR